MKRVLVILSILTVLITSTSNAQGLTNNAKIETVRANLMTVDSLKSKDFFYLEFLIIGELSKIIVFSPKKQDFQPSFVYSKLRIGSAYVLSLIKLEDTSPINCGLSIRLPHKNDIYVNSHLLFPKFSRQYLGQNLSGLFIEHL